jgi:predicted RNA methylase
VDHFYTPTSVAIRMVQCVSSTKISLIADFAAGYGELLRAGQSHWPGVPCIATDINKQVISKLRREESRWLIGNCDFLNPNSRRLCRALPNALGRVSVVLLNPPFSCRGARHYQVDFNESKIRCSLALAFVLESLPFLAPEGELVALLPVGCLVSQKDRAAWSTLRATHKIRIFETHGRGAFEDCHAETVIVRITPRKYRLRKESPRVRLIGSGNGCKNTVKIFRGKVQMHLANGVNEATSLPLIHTTELEAHKINLNARRVESKWESLSGPAVLLPRVGRFYPHKIQTYLGREPIVISDCIIALRCEQEQQVMDLYSVLSKNSSLIEKSYGGTCAKYITVESVCSLLKSFGFDVVLDNTRIDIEI